MTIALIETNVIKIFFIDDRMTLFPAFLRSPSLSDFFMLNGLHHTFLSDCILCSVTRKVLILQTDLQETVEPNFYDLRLG